MAIERARRKKNRWKYNIVLLPHGEAGKSLSFRMELVAAIGVVLLYTVAIGVLTIVLLKWTPLGVWIPVKNAELERKYGRQVTALQEQLNRIAADVTVLQRYNTKLRDALGSEFSRSETASPPLTDARAEELKKQTPGARKEKSEDLEEGTDFTTRSVSTTALDAHPVLGFPSLTATPRTSLPLQLPANGYVTRGFEPARGHYGIDIAGRRGSPIVASADGYILFAGWTYDTGYMMIIAHGGGYFTFYKHNQSLLKTANTFVRHGEPIALLGNTGAMSHGPHLHFEVWKDGIPRDPSEYVLNFHLF